jgi:hypothetical protein
MVLSGVMRAWTVLGAGVVCVVSCGGDDAPTTSPSPNGGQAGETDGVPSDGGDRPSSAGSHTAGGMPGAGNEAGEPAGGAGHVDESGGGGSGSVELVEIEAQASFIRYGTLRIVFDREVLAGGFKMELRPQTPSALALVGVEQVDEKTLDASLAFYHLPIDYELDLSGGLPSGGAFEAHVTVPGVGNGGRVAFLSKRTGNGALASWPGTAANATPVEAADAVCQSEAEAAGLRGTFQAFISLAGTLDAGCRALGLTGTLADKCGQAELPTDDAPILRRDGMPIVQGGSALLEDRWKVPVSLLADGSSTTAFYTWTGTITGAKGYANADCGAWSDATKKGVAATEVSQRILDYGFSRDCTVTGNLLCLQTGTGFFGPSELHEVSGKRAFVSKGKVYGNMSFGGELAVAAADALCQSEAAAASLDNADEFRAYLATAETDALCYVLGQTGKVVDKCGLESFSADHRWRRVDDYPLGSAAELAAGTLRAPLFLGADLTRLDNERPRTGVDQQGAASWNCADWTGTAAYSLSGHPGYDNAHWASHWTTDCDGEETSVYCFEP